MSLITQGLGAEYSTIDSKKFSIKNKKLNFKSKLITKEFSIKCEKIIFKYKEVE